MIRTAVLFPIPGGPEIRHAFAFKLSKLPPLPYATGFFSPFKTTFSQSFSQVSTFFTFDWLPTKSDISRGRYFSAQISCAGVALRDGCAGRAGATTGFATVGWVSAVDPDAGRSFKNAASSKISGPGNFAFPFSLISIAFLYFEPSSYER